MRRLATILFIINILAVTSCSTIMTTQQRTIPFQEIQYIDTTLIVSKTNKQYVIDTLGTPSIINESSFWYSFSGSKFNVRLKMIMRDGQQYNLIVGRLEKHYSISIDFDENGIIESISVT